MKWFNGLKRNYNVNDFVSKVEILNINQMLFKDINVLMFKQNFGQNPSGFLNVFTTAMSNHNTRNKSKYIPKLYFDSLCQQLISYRGLMFWKSSKLIEKYKTKFGVFLQKPSQICVQIHKVIDYSFINPGANLNIKRYSLLQ